MIVDKIPVNEMILDKITWRRFSADVMAKLVRYFIPENPKLNDTFYLKAITICSFIRTKKSQMPKQHSVTHFLKVYILLIDQSF